MTDKIDVLPPLPVMSEHDIYLEITAAWLTDGVIAHADSLLPVTDGHISAFRAGLKQAALICDAEMASHHSEFNMGLRTNFGKELAKAMGYGAHNCAIRIRALKGD